MQDYFQPACTLLASLPPNDHFHHPASLQITMYKLAPSRGHYLGGRPEQSLELATGGHLAAKTR